MDLAWLEKRDIDGGDRISAVLDDLARAPIQPWPATFRERLARGVAFVTFAFDIDGVSMEVAKYARCFEEILPGIPIHCLAGNFNEKADAVLDPSWHRHLLVGADGWDKWDGGKWFAQMFYEDLPPDSERCSKLAREIWHQALSLTERLREYLDRHDITLMVPVNTNSNPGNVAFSLAIVLAAETSGCAVLNNNHDFYWEGGKAGCKRGLSEPRGPRDHFFRNHDNEQFFSFFQRIYPWNGRRWVQVGINPLQERKLIDRFHFSPEAVFTIGTSLDPTFFREPTGEHKKTLRRQMTRLLGGNTVLEPISVARFRRTLDTWMADQGPVICGAVDEQKLDITGDSACYLLQPTRVVDRKRVWRDLHLMHALFDHPPFRQRFEQRPDATLTLHVTGPVPIEHRPCLEHVLDAYETVIGEVPDSLAKRVFLAFSAGRQIARGMDEELSIVDIYQLADMVVFPSLTEGRGLPIPESAAAGTPILCSRYEPAAVFAEVVGLDLPEDEQIQYLEFPEAEFPEELLARVTSILFEPGSEIERIERNRGAVRKRYSMDKLRNSFEKILDALERRSNRT